MKKIILSIAVVGFTAASALAGSCPGSGGCGGGDKSKEGSKEKDKGPAKPAMVLNLAV